jgi:hypothetical protein
MRELFAPLAAATDFFLAFADGHEGWGLGVGDWGRMGAESGMN